MTMFRMLFILIAMAAFPCFASQTPNASVFVIHERNSTDQITTVGVSNIFARTNSGFVSEVNTAFGYAEVLSEEGFLEEYPVWESGVKFGYYSTLFMYIEAGIDLAELALNSEREAESCCFSDDRRTNNQVDGYAGIGAGLDFGHTRLTVFVRARQIDANTWESQETVFSGVNLELKF